MCCFPECGVCDCVCVCVCVCESVVYSFGVCSQPFQSAKAINIWAAEPHATGSITNTKAARRRPAAPHQAAPPEQRAIGDGDGRWNVSERLQPGRLAARAARGARPGGTATRAWGHVCPISPQCTPNIGPGLCWGAGGHSMSMPRWQRDSHTFQPSALAASLRPQDAPYGCPAADHRP